MSRVEELRERIVSVCDVFIRPQSEAALIEERIDDLICASHAEGVAEGAEQERAWLKQYADKAGGAMQKLVGRLLETPKETVHD